MKLSEMTIDELYAEKNKVDETFPYTNDLKKSLITVFILGLTIILAIYGMKDRFSYILFGIILWMIYTVVQKMIYSNKIINEIKSR